MRTFRSILAGALAVALAVLMMGLPACGGGEEDAALPPREPHASYGPSVPDATIEAFRVCAKQTEHHKDDVYAYQFNVEVTESGSVERVKLKDEYPRNTGAESCLGHALENMRIPPFVAGRLFPQAVAVSPESRGLIGNPLLIAVAVLIEMVPATVVVDEATFMVAVILSGTEEAIEARKRRNRRREKCLGMFETCQNDRPSLCTRIIQGSETLCEICRTKCKANQPYERNECYDCGFSDIP